MFSASSAIPSVTVQNKFSNKGSINKLLKKSGEIRKKRVFNKDFKEEDDNIPSLPASMNAVIQPFQQKIDEMKKRVSDEAPFIKDALRVLPEGGFEELQHVFNNKMGGYTEERLFQSMYISTNISELDASINALMRLRKEYVQTYVEAFANEYNRKHGLDVAFNVEGFCSGIKSELDFRKGLRRAREARVSEQNEEPQDVSHNSRSIM